MLCARAHKHAPATAKEKSSRVDMHCSPAFTKKSVMFCVGPTKNRVRWVLPSQPEAREVPPCNPFGGTPSPAGGQFPQTVGRQALHARPQVNSRTRRAPLPRTCETSMTYTFLFQYLQAGLACVTHAAARATTARASGALTEDCILISRRAQAGTSACARAHAAVATAPPCSRLPAHATAPETSSAQSSRTARTRRPASGQTAPRPSAWAPACGRAAAARESPPHARQAGRKASERAPAVLAKEIHREHMRPEQLRVGARDAGDVHSARTSI